MSLLSKPTQPTLSPLKAFVDLVLFLSVMFGIRTFEIESFGFWGNALFKTISTIGVATILLYYRKQSWKDIGLLKPESIKKTLLISVISIVAAIGSVIVFQLFLRDLLFEESIATATHKSPFSDLKDNYMLFFSILPAVWLESMLEELQDRGFSFNRFEALISKVPVATILAVLFQAAIFGFRHSYDLSPRSMTTGCIGLAFGIVYVLSGRNLWPLIIAHCLLNTSSMWDKV